MPKFRLDQSYSSALEQAHANITVPGCGLYGLHGEQPILYIDISEDRQILQVWADITSDQPTHTIDLSKARLNSTAITEVKAQDHGSEPELAASGERAGRGKHHRNAH